MAQRVRKGGKKNRKIGRNKIKCELYRKFKAEKNKVKKIARHLRRFPGDAAAERRLAEIKKEGLAIRGSAKV